MAEVNAVRASVTNIGDEVISLVRDRASTDAIGANSLALALGRLCALLDLDPQLMKDCIDRAYSEQRRLSQEAPEEYG